jgi:hypothetical protein
MILGRIRAPSQVVGGRVDVCLMLSRPVPPNRWDVAKQVCYDPIYSSGLNATHTPHHVVQAAVSLAPSRGTGITINLAKELHISTRTFRRPVDATLSLRTHLARDIRDLRGILSGAGYNRGVINRQLQELIRQNKGVGGFGK